MDLQKTYNNILTGGGQLLSNIGKGVSSAVNNIGNFETQGAQMVSQGIQNGANTLARNLPAVNAFQPQGIGLNLKAPINFNITPYAQQFLQGAGQAIGQALPATQRLISNSFSPQYQNVQQPLSDAGALLRGVGYTVAPEQALIGGGINSIFNAGQNLLAGKPLMNNAPQAFRQGSDFGATVAPIGETASLLAKPITNNIGRLIPGENGWSTLARNVLGGVGEQSLTGAGYGAVTGQNPVSTALQFAPYGITHGLNPNIKAERDLNNVNEVQQWKPAFDAVKDTRIADKLSKTISEFEKIKQMGGSTDQFKQIFNEASQFLPDKAKNLPVEEQANVWSYIMNRLEGISSQKVPKALEGIDWMMKPKTLTGSMGLVDSGIFKEPYKKGDITELKNYQDAILGDKSTRSAKNISMLAELEDAAQRGNSQAKAQLEALNLVDEQLQKATEARDAGVNPLVGEAKLYHGTDNPNTILQSVKPGEGYHPGAGPVEFLGPSFSTSKDVASSYGKNIIEHNWTPTNPKKFQSLQAVKNDIIKTFGLPQKGQNVGTYYRDIADSYRVKLQSEGFDAVTFPEGAKNNVKVGGAKTVIPITDNFSIKSNQSLGGGNVAQQPLSDINQFANKDLTFYRNPEKAPNMGARFAQGIEPKGQYINLMEKGQTSVPQGWESGTVNFKNPLVIDWKSSGEGGWKTDLSKQFGGKTGQSLTDAVREAGYDGIITVDKGNPQEVVNLQGRSPQQPLGEVKKVTPITPVKPVSLHDQYSAELTKGVNMPKTPTGNPDPLPWETGTGADISKSQLESNKGQLVSETQNSKPQVDQSRTATINQKLKGGKYKFDEGMGAGVPKTPPEKPPIIETPSTPLKDILSNRYAISAQIEQRARVLKGLQDQGISSGEHNLYRDVIEHPEDLQKALQKVKNPQAFERAVAAHREFTNYIYDANKASGGTVGYVKNFATHIWDLTDPVKKAEYDALLQGKAKNFKGYFNKSRVFKDIREGNAAGFELKNKTAQEDITTLSNAAQKEITGRTFANQLKAAYPNDVHIVTNEGVPPPNAIQLKIPGMKGTFVSPSLYKQVKFLEPLDLGKGGKAIDFVSGGIKHMELSGGLFHVKNTGLDYLGSHLAYGKMPRVDQAAHVFFSDSAMTDMRNGWVKSGLMDKMIKSNVTLSKAQDFPSVGKEGAVRSFISKINPLSMLNRATFTRLEDYFKASTFDILDKKGKIDLSTPEGVRNAQKIGAQLNNIFGGQNRSVGDSVIKSKFGQWLGRQAILAPDYQEGRFKRTLSAINPNITGHDIGKLPARTEANNFAFRTLAGRMIVTAVLAELSRRVISGKFNDLKDVIQNDIIDPNYPTPFTNKNSKGQDVTQVAHIPASNPSDMLKLAQDPEHFAISHLGAGLSTGIGYVSNQDYFGNKLSNTNNPIEKLTNIGQSKLPIPLVQGQKLLQGKISPGNAAINILGDRVTQNPTDPIVMQNKLGSNAYDTAYQNALSQGKSDLVAQLAGTQAYNIVKKTGQSPFDANGQNTGVANGTKLLTTDNKIIDLSPPTTGQGIDAFTNKNWNVTKALDVWKNKDKLSSQQVSDAFNKLGVDPQDVRYAYLASHTTDVSTQYIESKSPTHDQLMNNLITGRVVGINGQQFANNAVVDNFYNKGMISKSEATALKNTKTDKTGNNLNAPKVRTGRKVSVSSLPKIPKLKLGKPRAVSVKAVKSSTYTLKAPTLKIAAIPRFGVLPKIKKTKLSA